MEKLQSLKLEHKHTNNSISFVIGTKGSQGLKIPQLIDILNMLIKTAKDENLIESLTKFCNQLLNNQVLTIRGFEVDRKTKKSCLVRLVVKLKGIEGHVDFHSSMYFEATRTETLVIV